MIKTLERLCIVGLIFFICFVENGSFMEADERSSPKIVGGSSAQPNEIPYQVSLQLKKGGHICGGAIIDLRHILTAAHCLYNGKNPVKPSEIHVYVGSINLNGGGRFMDVKTVHIHKAYSSSNFFNDIGILKLTTALVTSSSVLAIRLRQTGTLANETCKVSGWGSLYSGGQTVANLQQVSLPIYNHTACEIAYRSIGGIITSNMICAGNATGGKDACQGDSGGPLACSGALAGLVSFGYGCARPNFPGVYTEVAKYSSWIRQVTNGSTTAFSAPYIYIMAIILLAFNKVGNNL